MRCAKRPSGGFEGIDILKITSYDSLILQKKVAYLCGMLQSMEIEILASVIFKIPDMIKQGWFIPILIMAINALAIIVRWSSLPEMLPAHFDLQGNAGGTMPRNVLILYPLIGAAAGLIVYLLARKMPKLQKGLVILASGIGLILLCSVMVTLTAGKMPLFMLAEPVILILTVIAFIICALKSRKTRR